MDALKRRRSTIKGQMTKIVTFAEAITDTTSFDDIKVRLDKTISLYSDFTRCEDEIFAEDGNWLSQTDQFDESYYHAVSLLNAAIRRFHTADQLNTSGQSGVNTTNCHAASETKLPRLNIQPFQGDFKEWQSFFDLFNSCVHEKMSLAAAQKLQYLKSLLKGEPLGLIKHLTSTDTNYIEAYQILCKRYDKKKATINCYIEAFVKQAVVTRVNSSNIRKLADTTEEIIRGLKAVGPQGEVRDPWLIYLIVDKLDDDSKQFWQQESSKIEHPTLQNLIDCLHTRADSIEGVKETIQKPSSRTTLTLGEVYTTTTNTGKPPNCPFCNIEHMLYLCPKFNGMNIADRRVYIKENFRCYNCLSDSHTVKACRSKRSCQICKKRHNSLLHELDSSNLNQAVSQSATISQPAITVQFASNPPTNLATLLPPITNIPPKPTTMLITNLSSPNAPESGTQPHITTAIHEACLPITSELESTKHKFHSLLPTALVHVKDVCGKLRLCRALLDSGSQASFVTDACVNRLSIPRQETNISIIGVGDTKAGTARSSAVLEISSRYHPNNVIQVQALILPKITAILPPVELNSEFMTQLTSLQLADPVFNESNCLDILLGVEHFFNILTEGRIYQGQNTPIAQNSIFGWIIAGTVQSNDNQHSFSVNLNTELKIDLSLRQFWEIEEIPPSKHLTEEEKLCEIHFETTYQRTNNGRFLLHLPFKETKKELGNSRDMAVRRLHAMENKFRKFPNLKIDYVKFMREYITLGHMERILPTNLIVDHKSTYYMPHHAVFKQSSTTTKLRVVFDASATTSTKISLNDNLMVGPTVQNSLFTILLRFRKHLIVFTSDIEKMYRQILIAPDDTEFQRIVWRENAESPVEDFRLLTVTYGTASAPYLATKTLSMIADENSTKYPAASKIIKNDLYVDDLMSGANTEKEAIELQNQIFNILKLAGFNLRKWTSNCTSLLNCIPPEAQELSPIEISEESRSIKLLGLEWCPKNDYFHFKVMINPKITNTKREMLSEASKIFDPLGWLSPSTIMVKILFQSLWLLNLQWDDPLPVHIAKRWQELRRDLSDIDKITIPRWLFTENAKFQLHGFSDSSEYAYSAVIYTRTRNKDGSFRTNIVCAKTRVAPIKHMSIPRLELCGALLLTKLLKTVLESINSEIVDVFTWTDSMNVLWWLSSHPRSWKSFVANRTAEILESTSRKNWGYVPTKENPADCASRGLLPSKLKPFDLWWNGPTWLRQDQSFWPSQANLFRAKLHTNEEKPVKLTSMEATISNSFLEELSQRYSTFSKLSRIIALLLQFHNNLKGSIKKEPTAQRLSLEICSQATNIIFRWIQTDCFGMEIVCLKNQKALPKHSKLIALNPIFDNHGILRVGSRIQHANVEYNKKFPIILPAKHRITVLIIDEMHIKYLHAAQSLMVSTLRQKYWIINCKDMVRQRIHCCIPCTRYRPQKIVQLMGDLPPARVNLKYVFNQTGVDYAGPIWLRSMVGRRNKPHKGYIAIFVCMSSKAVHIELVSDLSTSAFLAALKRFMSRRGVCSDIFSDNGTNFIGAKNQLQEIYKLNKSLNHNNLVSKFLLDYQTRWHFSPPSGPNHGGLYEAAVRSTKYHLRRVLGNTTLNFEEMATLLTQIEAILNSRPLCSLSPEDVDVLTPAHFIIGHPLTLPPDPDFKNDKQNTLTRWHLIQQMVQHFWNRFYAEYLTTLPNRSKWQHKHVNIKVNDIVLIRDDNIPPAQWPLGKVIQTHPGQDGLVRVVSIQSKNGIFKRPISKIVLLPVA